MQPEEHTVTHTINRYRSFRYELILEGVVVGAPLKSTHNENSGNG